MQSEGLARPDNSSGWVPGCEQRRRCTHRMACFAPAELASDLVVQFLGANAAHLVLSLVSGSQFRRDPVGRPEVGPRTSSNAVQACTRRATRRKLQSAGDNVRRFTRPTTPEDDESFTARSPCLKPMMTDDLTVDAGRVRLLDRR